jgi:hypothetical protein
MPLWTAVMGTGSAGFGGATASYTNMTWYDAHGVLVPAHRAHGPQLPHGHRSGVGVRREELIAQAREGRHRRGVGVQHLERRALGGDRSCRDLQWSAHPEDPPRRARDGRQHHRAPDPLHRRDWPALRLAISDEMDFPPGMVPACQLHAPKVGGEPENSYRDPRWITGSGRRWKTGSIAIGNFDLRVWDDGTARLGNTNGQWFTSNNIAFVFVPNTGAHHQIRLHPAGHDAGVADLRQGLHEWRVHRAHRERHRRPTSPNPPSPL